MCGSPCTPNRIWSWLVHHFPPHPTDFGLSEDATLFMHSQWSIPQPVFIAYRAFLACYTFAWLIMSIVNAGQTTGLGGFFVFLTNWTYILLSFYLVISCISTSYASYRTRQCPSDGNLNKAEAAPIRQPGSNDNYPQSSSPDSESSGSVPEDISPQTTPTRLPFYFKITWVLLNVCLAFGPIISIIYWAFIFDPEFVYANQGGAYGVALTVHRHAFNTIFVYLDLAVSASPITFWHFVYPVGYGLLYMFFSLVYYWAGGTNPYIDSPAIYPSLLDWTNPGKTIGAVIAFAVVAIVFHSVAYGCYRLRMCVAGRFDMLTRAQLQARTLRNETHAGPGEEENQSTVVV
ncbi:protein rolling stone-like [Acanthaster planci]|uniref:Protein rolling stone-like n=1 Tax=Acanthaster planci TaxID=133434 RepID=A0A8B7YNF7_ACAPL|nr:protein rolling stone-like [Acanthaster planci]